MTDLHGSRWKYDRLLKRALQHRIDVVVNGGDMLPNDEGFAAQGDFIRDYLKRHFAEFDEAGIRYLCCPGNDDLMVFDELFEAACSETSTVRNLAQRKVAIGEFEFIGMNWVVDYPFRLKDRCRMDTKDFEFPNQFGPGLLSTRAGELTDWFSYARSLPTIADELERLVKPTPAANAVYVIHMPPRGLGLDKCMDGREVGSAAVRDFLLRCQPRLALHGHVHESPSVTGKWFAHVGRTLCIQPGQLGPFCYATIEMETMTFERHTESIP